MAIIKICGVIILSVSLVWVLKTFDNKLAAMVSVLTFLVVSIYIMTTLTPIIGLARSLSSAIEDKMNVLETLLKVCGIQILVRCMSAVCVESGEKSLLTLLEWSGDIATLLLALPFFENLFETILGLLKEV